MTDTEPNPTSNAKSSQDGKWPAARVFHLGGGLRAFNGFDNDIKILTPALTGGPVVLHTPDYPSAYGVLRRLGRSVIGIDFLTHKEEFEGVAPPNWRSFYEGNGTATLCAEQADQWRFLAHASIKTREATLYDVASRISYQLRVCDWRLRQISEAYERQLIYKLRTSHEFKDGSRFLDQFTWLGYLTLQSYLVDACVLRDYLAEFYAWTCVKADILPHTPVIRTMAGLKKNVLDKESEPSHLAAQLKQATEQGGWLYNLGRYRDLVVHSAPLESAGKRLMAQTRHLPTLGAGSLPIVQFPLPLDPKKLIDDRATGKHLDDPDFGFARMGHAIADPGEHPDGLEYSHWTLCWLTWLANQFLQLAPFKGTIPHFVVGEDGMAKDADG